jgi:hypothetical protein
VSVFNEKGVLVGRRTLAFTCAFCFTSFEMCFGFGHKGEERYDEEVTEKLHVVC